jgi:hypothetical protein
MTKLRAVMLIDIEVPKDVILIGQIGEKFKQETEIIKDIIGNFKNVKVVHSDSAIVSRRKGTDFALIKDITFRGNKDEEQ